MMDLFAYSPDAAIIVQSLADRRLVQACSPAFHKLTGCACEETIGHDLASLKPQGANPLWPIIDRLCASIGPDNPEAYAESYFTLSDMEPLFGELYAKRMPEPPGDCILVTIRDRTEHKWIEDQTLQRDVLLSMLLTKADTVVAMRNYRTPIMYDRLELSRMNSDLFVVEQDRARVREQLLSIRNRGETGELRFILQLFEERFHVHSLIKPFYNGDRSFRCHAILVLEMTPYDGSAATQDLQTEATGRGASNTPDPASDQNDSSFKLRLLMLEKRMSVTQLAENTKISLTTISNIRNGKIKKPQRLTAKLIADELGVTELDIWGPYK